MDGLPLRSLARNKEPLRAIQNLAYLGLAYKVLEPVLRVGSTLIVVDETDKLTGIGTIQAISTKQAREDAKGLERKASTTRVDEKTSVSHRQPRKIKR